MSQIENELLGNLHDVIEKNSKQIISSLDCKPLFGAVGGSLSLNLANKSSDVDCYIVTDSDTTYSQREVPLTYTVFLKDLKLDFMCVPINELIEKCTEYYNQKHIYPTRLHRELNEMDRIKNTKDIARPDFKREMVMRIYLADKIFEFKKNSAKESYERLKKGLRFIDIWDAHFSRAYGNYYETIEGHETVLLRKYLYTISEITICHLIMSRKEKPIMNYKHMFAPPIAHMKIIK